jgi:nucleotide-binding universal stress UspA family protein
MTILFAYDGSDGANAAIEKTARLIGRADADAVVLSVWEPLTVAALRAVSLGGPLAVPLDVETEDERSADNALQLAEHGAERARALGFNARAAAIADEREVADTIVAHADEVDADLVVVGARALTGLRAFLGSVSNHVLQHAHRPVLVVPPAKTVASEAHAD